MAVLPELDHESDRFVLEDRAGGGGMGDVYRAIDTQSGARVAVKVLRSSAATVERARFQREIAVIADLRHPNVVEYLAHGLLPDGRPFYAMEWLDGEDLTQRQRHDPLGMRDAVEAIRRACQAITAVHARGIVHRDLKLGNIFLIGGRSVNVKLIDFGVVMIPGHDLAEDRGAILGTPHFMAPEQARGELVDARADVYSLGAALFKLITGRNVFDTDHIIALLGRLVLEDPQGPQVLRFDVPDALDRVILQAISRRADDRFENAGELARALARVGDLNNDPPNMDRSASAIRRTHAAIPLAAETETDKRREQVAERRVVAAVMFDLGNWAIDGELQAELAEILGPDARSELLLGGRLVTVLGVTQSQGDEGLRAARAALRVTTSLPETRAVVAVGHAIASPASTSSRSRSSNLAAQALERAAHQLEQAEAGTVRVDSALVPALSGRFVMQEDAFGAVLLREDPAAFGARLLLGKPTPTLGRDKELALLASLYQELSDEGTPRAALVTGPAGIGKSRVRQELLTALEISPLPPEVLLVRGDPMTQQSSLSCFGRAMRSLVGVHDGESSAQQVEKVRQHLNFRLPKALRFLSSFLAELLGVPFPDENDEALRAARASSQLMQSRTRMALEAFVRSQADLMPQVLLLEDAQWVDETTIDLIDWLLGCPDLKFAVYAFGRPELDQRPAALWANKNVTRLALAPLSRSASDKLVRAVMPECDSDLRANLVERAGGNVLFLEELIRASASGEDELPLTVQALLQMRLDRMPKETREVVRAASVLGPVFWTGAVSTLMGHNVEQELIALQEDEVFARQPTSRVSGEPEWTFRQALLRDAAYQTILEEDRAGLHRQVATWLEQKGGTDIGLIAQHADAGEDYERAAQLYARATRQAYSNGAHLEIALELAERGLDCGPPDALKAELFLAAAQARIPLGRLEDGVRAAEQAVLLSEMGSDMWAEAQSLAATALIQSGRAADGDLRAKLALAPEHEARISANVRIGLMAARVRGLVEIEGPRAALALADQALELARNQASNEPLLRVLDARLYALMHTGDASGVIAQGPTLIDIADTAGDVVRATRARINTASSMNLVGMFEDARALLDRALNDSRDRRMRILEAFALHNLGMTEARLGLLDRGLSMQREAGRIGDETGAARLRVNARVYEALIMLWKHAVARTEGRGPESGTDNQSAAALASFVEAEARSLPSLGTTADFIVAAAAASRGMTAEAERISAQAVANLPTVPMEEWEELLRLTLVESRITLGDEEGANRALEDLFTMICERARKLTRPEQRNSYLERLAEVRRTVELGRARLGKQLPFFATLPLRPPPRRPPPGRPPQGGTPLS